MNQNKKVLMLYGKNEKTDNPLALENLRKFCLADSYITRIFDFETFTFEQNDDISAVVSKIVARAPAIIAASCYIWNTDLILNICRLVKEIKPSIIFILGGPEVSYEPEIICLDNPFIDMIVSGEGEKTFSLLLKKIAANDSIDELEGVTYRVNDRIYFKAPRLLINLEQLPLLFNDGNKDYLSSLEGKVSYETSRGCSHSCSYCDCGCLNRGPVRFFPYERIESAIGI
jgi:radical SAM superfamily enzyme YgiQ (UPF0313 family)